MPQDREDDEDLKDSGRDDDDIELNDDVDFDDLGPDDFIVDDEQQQISGAVQSCTVTADAQTTVNGRF